MSVDTYTTGKLGLIEPARGAYVDTWDSPLFANWQTLEASVSGTTTLTLSNANVVLTVPTYPTNANPPSVATSAQNLRLYLTGTLTANINIYIPSTVGGFWIVDNQTTGSYTVTVLTTAVGSTGVACIQSFASIIYSNGTNVNFADTGGCVNAINNYVPQFPAGSIISYAGVTIPSGWIYCNGAQVSRTTYSTLFTAIGTLWGAGNGSTTFNVPNLVGQFLRGAGGNGPATVGTFQGNQAGPHTHPVTINDPGHFHTLTNVMYISSGGLYSGGNLGAGAPKTDTAVTNITATTSNPSGNETRPDNYGVYYMIKA
jgi:microcystin-dependent protein